MGSTFQRNSGCISPLAANTHSQLNSNGYSSWTQGCTEPPVYGAKQCGTRSYSGPVPGLQHGQTSPGEFPWTCILLNQNNDFIGTCAVIPDDFSNNNNAPTRKILTASHKLKNIEQTDLLKVGVGEWDATGFNAPESQPHEEYTVTRILKHPEMSLTRLDNNLTIPNVNTACLPACHNQFDFLFSNGTGVRCHVAGWGKDEVDGQFQFIPKKVDLSLIPAAQCEAALKLALNARKPGAGDRFQLDASEVCAGGRLARTPALETEDLLWSARPSLAGGPWWVSSHGALDVPPTFQGSTSISLTTEIGLTPTKIMNNLSIV